MKSFDACTGVEWRAWWSGSSSGGSSNGGGSSGGSGSGSSGGSHCSLKVKAETFDGLDSSYSCLGLTFSRSTCSYVCIHDEFMHIAIFLAIYSTTVSMWLSILSSIFCSYLSCYLPIHACLHHASCIIHHPSCIPASSHLTSPSLL